MTTFVLIATIVKKKTKMTVVTSVNIKHRHSSISRPFFLIHDTKNRISLILNNGVSGSLGVIADTCVKIVSK